MIYPTDEDALKGLHKIAQSNFVDISGGSSSIEEWADEIHRIYIRGNRRPKVIVLILERCGECYRGALYVSKEDFSGHQKVE